MMGHRKSNSTGMVLFILPPFPYSPPRCMSEISIRSSETIPTQASLK
jgi:hypothetical protein